MNDFARLGCRRSPDLYRSEPTDPPNGKPNLEIENYLNDVPKIMFSNQTAMAMWLGSQTTGPLVRFEIKSFIRKGTITHIILQNDLDARYIQIDKNKVKVVGWISEYDAHAALYHSK